MREDQGGRETPIARLRSHLQARGILLCNLSSKAYSDAFDALLSAMLVTVVGRERDLSSTWSAFRWGTYLDWEKGVPLCDPDDAQLHGILEASLDPATLDRWLDPSGRRRPATVRGQPDAPEQSPVPLTQARS